MMSLIFPAKILDQAQAPGEVLSGRFLGLPQEPAYWILEGKWITFRGTNLVEFS